MSKLNKNQQAAAEFFEGVAVVIAVPGSGKTLTMMERIGFLVNEHGISPENILGLTFTKNASLEMRNRLIHVLGDLSSRVHLSTIHSFCFSLLKHEGTIFNILSGKDQIIFIKNIMKKLKIKDLSIGMILGEISLAKNNLITVDEFRDLYSGDKTMLKIGDVYECYDKDKSEKMLMDFDDLLIKVYQLLNENDEVREKYQCKCSHILVDEFQDTNPAQMEILKLLINDSNSEDESSFWVCGDDWQSIYGWCGASVHNILNFNEIFPDGAQFILDLNYRSTPQILRACQNLIQHNDKQVVKVLKTNNTDGEDVIVLESSSEEMEALNIINEIKELVENREYPHKDIAVLYRCNFQSRVIEEAFSQHKIPYYIENGLNFYNRREVKILLDYLRFIVNPNSDEGDDALLNILNVPNRYIGHTFLRKLENYSKEKDIHYHEGLVKMRLSPPYIRHNIEEFLAFIYHWIDESEDIPPARMIQMLRDTLSYDQYITEDDIPSPDDVKISNLNQLEWSASKFDDIRSFLDYVESFEDIGINDNRDGVKLMTVHKAKGLEFPVVFLIGLVEGLLPTKKSDLSEERRVCFVAISRAMELLYLSYSHNHLGQAAKKSIFLSEILGDEESQLAA